VAEVDMLRVLDEVGDKVLPDALSFGYHGLGVAQLAQNRAGDALVSFAQVLRATGRDFESGMDHPRIQLVAVPYARALRQSGKIDAAIELLRSVIAQTPLEEPDQRLVDAYSELAFALDVAGDKQGAVAARANYALFQQRLWDASFQYRLAQFDNTIENERRQQENARTKLREDELQAQAERDSASKYQYWVMAAMLVALLLALNSSRLQRRLANSERMVNERLEALVKTRTRSLEDEMTERMRTDIERQELQIKLAEAEKMRAMGELTAGVAHDFNNLMTRFGQPHHQWLVGLCSKTTATTRSIAVRRLPYRTDTSVPQHPW